MKSNISYNYVIHQLERIDFSIIDMKEIINKFISNSEAEWKKQREFRKEQGEFAKFLMGFINSYSDNSVKNSYSDISMRCSYMVSNLNSYLLLFIPNVIVVFNNNSYYCLQALNDVGDHHDHTSLSF